jgi:hypothetical protein
VGAVGLIGGGDHDPLHAGRPAGLQQDPGPLDVALEGGDGGGVCVADDRLGGEVEDRVDRALADQPEDEIAVAQVADRVVHLLGDPEQLEPVGVGPSRSSELTSAPESSSALASQEPANPRPR